MRNLFLQLFFVSCQNALKAKGKKKGLAVFVIPDKDPVNGFYGSSRSATEKYRGNVTTITNTRDMVNQLWQIARTAQAKIDFLSITAHGTAQGILGAPEGVFLIGSDRVTLPVLTTPTDPVTVELTRLRGVFAPGAVVELRACLIGQELPLVQAFSDALGGVRVLASRAMQFGPYPELVGGRFQVYKCEMGTCSLDRPYDPQRVCGPGR